MSGAGKACKAFAASTAARCTGEPSRLKNIGWDYSCQDQPPPPGRESGSGWPVKGSMLMCFSNMQHFLLRTAINKPINYSSMNGSSFLSDIIRPPPPPIPASPAPTCLSVSGEFCAQVPCTACWRGRAPAAPPPCSRSQCRTAQCAWWSSTLCR